MRRCCDAVTEDGLDPCEVELDRESKRQKRPEAAQRVGGGGKST
jgi:hypothetical protein